MKEMEYITGVARIRAHENHLLSSMDIDRMVTAKAEADIIQVLSEKNWPVDVGLPALFAAESRRMWTLIEECAPDFSEFSMFLTQNDFHNLKAILKGTITGISYEKFLLYPTFTPVALMEKAVSERSFAALPSYMQSAASDAFDALAHATDGQYADICLDSAMLESILFLAQETKLPLLQELSEQTVACANIRIAAREATMKKGKQLLDAAIVRCQTLEKEALIVASLQGTSALIDLLEKSRYDKAALALRSSISELERWCDIAPMEFIKAHKNDPFGIAALAAYVLYKENEIKTARILISGKKAGLSQEELRRRIRAAA